MVLDLEILTHFLHHFIVQIGGIISDNLLGQPIPADYLFLDEPNHHTFSHTGIRCRFNPFGEVVNGDQNEVVSIRVGISAKVAFPASRALFLK